jgi:ubiquinone/menaquinone biosynthesis C-methylase UbiE
MSEDRESPQEQYSSPIYVAFDEAIEVDETMGKLAGLDLAGTIADIGSGYGTYLKVLRPSWDRYVGVEPNRFLLEEASKRASKLGIRCTFVAGVAENIPLKANVADTVLSTYVLGELESVPRVRKALEEMARIAKPRGQLVICDLTGGDEDGWTDLLNVAEAARGCLPSRELADVWIEVFSFLTRHAHIDAMDRLSIVYRFGDIADAFEKFQALVPDLREDRNVEKAVRHHFREPHLTTEGFLIRATLND